MAEHLGGGHIHPINVSRGGVPKHSMEQGFVTIEGLEGDFHDDYPRSHGGPLRSLCLYTLEAIHTLQAEGHPVFPGSMGENITLAGITLAALTPGTHLALGDEVEIEITSYTIPCKTIAASFSDGDFTRVSQKLHSGASRVYASILRSGKVRVGQRAALLAPSQEYAQERAQ